MSSGKLFVMAGGGTGGHVIPALAVARVLESHGHRVLFVGTERGLESKLVPAAGFPIEWIEVGGLKGQGAGRRLRSISQLPIAGRKVMRLFDRERPAAVFSMGGYVAGPVAIAAILRRIPLVLMEPNAIPGVTNRYLGRFVTRALVSFPEAMRWFPAGRSEITGIPVRPEFFNVPQKPRGDRFTVLITGGSQGARTLNRAAVDSWPLFREAKSPVRLYHQTGNDAYAEISAQFGKAGIEGEVMSFIPDMPAMFAAANLVVCRAGAGAVAEVAAAGKASILVPYPFAADQHQRRNAQALARAGAARLVLDSEMTGPRLVQEVTSLAESGTEELGARAREFATPGAAERAAAVLEEVARN
jgi:UDP-N-acetylglucosamine--N-acetylmuramyl-(pentapeptide) pyrophosphoryl-undecaprenol N-acetylglucosamine transferase